jgi:transposase
VLPRQVTFTQADADHDCRSNWRTTAMAMLADHYDYVIGGDPDRDTIDLAVVDTRTGGVQAQTVETADGTGYARLLEWGGQHAPGRRVFEGTASFAVGFVTCLVGAGEDVVEVGGVKRARGSKNDQIDAVRAARHALSSEHQATPRARGRREAIRLVMNTRHAG